MHIFCWLQFVQEQRDALVQEQRDALAYSPTVVLMMESVLDRMSRNRKEFPGADIHPAADDTSLCIFQRPA